jgi:hypothetical protein
LVCVLLFASPTLSQTWHLPGGESFSELWVLGPEQMAGNYPFNVKANESYLVYVGVGNHMGSSVYYVVFVKFRNETEALPNATDGTPSPLPQLYEYHVFLQDGGNWTAPLTFSFSGITFIGNQSMVKGLRINDGAYNIDKVTSWDTENKGYYYQLFIELWIFNEESNVLQFHNRFVGIWLNMTENL